VHNGADDFAEDEVAVLADGAVGAVGYGFVDLSQELRLT